MNVHRRLFLPQKPKGSASASNRPGASTEGGEASATVTDEHPQENIDGGNEIMESQNQQDGDH